MDENKAKSAISHGLAALLVIVGSAIFYGAGSLFGSYVELTTYHPLALIFVGAMLSMAAFLVVALAWSLFQLLVLAIEEKL